MTLVHIYAPPVTRFAAVNDCPVCERPRRMLGEHAEWYGATWTCCGCGDQWQDGYRQDRPFAPGWRQRSIRRARAGLATLGLQA